MSTGRSSADEKPALFTILSSSLFRMHPQNKEGQILHKQKKFYVVLTYKFMLCLQKKNNEDTIWQVFQADRRTTRCAFMSN